MKPTFIKNILVLLICVMVCSVFASCDIFTRPNTETVISTERETEKPTETQTESKETERVTEAEQETSSETQDTEPETDTKSEIQTDTESEETSDQPTEKATEETTEDSAVDSEEESTEKTTEKQTEKATEKDTEDTEDPTEEPTKEPAEEPTEEPDELNTSPVELTPVVDLFPECSESETIVSSYSKQIGISYAVDISKYKYADILTAATSLNVFDCTYPIKLTYSHKGNSSVMITITDMSGDNTIYRGTISASTSSYKTLEKIIKNHPTGYFKITAGAYTDYYVVTPAYANRTIKDSPFAMDSSLSHPVASGSYLTDEQIKSYSSALRLIGVTWIRERIGWSYYQIPNSDGTFKQYSSTYLPNLKRQFGIIQNTGMNILATFSDGDNWAQKATYSGSQVTTGSFLGTYGTQTAVYDATYRLAKELNGYVDVLELMNEPDHPSFRDVAEQYASWFKSAALGIIDSGADIKISLGGLCANPNDYIFLPVLLESDVLRYASVFNYHAHVYDINDENFVPDFGYTAPSGSPSKKYVREILGIVDYYEIDQPIWISESGLKILSTTPTDAQKEMQAPYIVTSAVQSLSYGTDKYFWFLATPYTENGGDFSSFTKDGKPYPTIAAHAVMTSVLRKAKYIGELKYLPGDNARGYLFYTGKRIVSVVWMTQGTEAYTFAADERVLVTTMMGEEKLYYPDANGNISVSIGVEPIYITYSTPPTDYYEQSFADSELEAPEINADDEAAHVIITPEFTGYTYNYEEKRLYGHKIETGTEIKVRVVNHSNKTITGKVSVNLPGFTVSGIDQSITVEAAPEGQWDKEGFINLTLTKTGSATVDDIVKFNFTFTFEGETEEHTTSAAVSVYSGDQTSRNVSRNSFSFGTWNTYLENAKSLLSTVYFTPTNFSGSKSDIKVYINGEEFTNFDYRSGKIYLYFGRLNNGAGLSGGKHVVSVCLTTPGGDLRIVPMTIRYDDENNKVLFSNTR